VPTGSILIALSWLDDRSSVGSDEEALEFVAGCAVSSRVPIDHDCAQIPAVPLG